MTCLLQLNLQSHKDIPKQKQLEICITLLKCKVQNHKLSKQKSKRRQLFCIKDVVLKYNFVLLVLFVLLYQIH